MKTFRIALVIDAVLIMLFALFIFVNWRKDDTTKEIVYNEFSARIAENYDDVFTYEDAKKYGLTDFEYNILDVTKNDKASGVYSIYGEYAVQIELKCYSSQDLDNTKKSLLAYAVERCIPDNPQQTFKTSTGNYVTTTQFYGNGSSDKMIYTYVNGELIHKPDDTMPNGALYSYQELQIVLIIIFCLLLVAIPGVFALRKMSADMDAIASYNQRKEKLIKFYDDCIENGVKECVSQKEIQKATLIAQRESIPFSSITDLFAEAKSFKVESLEELEAHTLEALRVTEKRKLAELVRYSDLSGRNKRITMLQDKYKDCLDTAKTLRSGVHSVMSASQSKEKEGNWAIMGGIASAIAGPAAGVATALNEQAKTAQENAEIRVQNQRNREILAPTLMTSYSKAIQKEAEAKNIASAIEDAKTKLVSDDTAQMCLKMLHFSDTKVEVSHTGTCTITTIVSTKPFMIFDDVPAVIDGTIIAKIYDNEKMIGTAQMVLPLYGISGETQLTGMLLFCGQVGSSYKVEFTAENLWAMEK